MATTPDLDSSVDVMRAKLKGVCVEPGALVSLRDAPAFEMVMRLNQRHRGKLVAALLTSSRTPGVAKSDDALQGGLKEDNRDTIGSTRGSEYSRLVFVPAAYEVFLENEMQKWLDPFYGRVEAAALKRARGERDNSSSDDEEFMGDGVDNDDSLSD
ncbi:hypothetical protein TraAM80_03349 [Trypanosoma rangeli]|uniref:Uncharacterized protein n=1 Tax=Trypanosoma rangeli TaxID=5698 RepID=A0A422NPT6_TRYRA|nr:uncharacterized protein TraAM80_03349 [Trypanosoma rangeli]RNF07493.1 hypothetical protein TraAM80_03349 [Trypanosoma rangeli]|eukprot:RNF07493.1 hypothetical protein TraAM80_03349 [Trypanosoma rangeli]